MPQATQPVVGPAQYADGSPVNPRATRDGAQATQDAHGRYLEAVARGNVYSASTPVAGVAPGTALGTTASFCLYNPLNSGVALSVLRTSWAFLSGTLGAGFIAYCTNGVTGAQAGTIPTGTAMVPKNAQIGNGSTPKGLPLSGATVVTTAGGLLRPVWSLLPWLATTAIPVPMMVDDVAGEFEVLPGNIFCMHAVAGAGTSPLGVWGCTWEEYAIGVAQIG